MPQRPVRLCYSSYEKLYYQVRGFVERHVWFSKAIYYDIVTAWIIATYLAQRFEYVPYLAFIGPPSSGKTRALEVAESLSWMPIMSPSISVASLYRIIEKRHPTVLIDEGGRTSLSPEMMSILNAGQRKGQKAYRTEEVTTKEGRQYEVREYDLFGFKAYAALVDQHQTLASRSLTIRMSKKAGAMPRRLDRERAQKLRVALENDMGYWDGLPDVGGYLTELRDGRLVELIEPLLQVLPGDRERQKLVDYASELEADRIREEIEGIQATVFHAFLDARGERRFVPIADIARKINENLEERDRIRNATIGRQLKALGFRLDKENRVRGVSCDADQERELLERYPVSIPESPSHPSRRPSQPSNKGTEGQWGRFFQGVEDNRESTRQDTRHHGVPRPEIP